MGIACLVGRWIEVSEAPLPTYTLESGNPRSVQSGSARFLVQGVGVGRDLKENLMVKAQGDDTPYVMDPAATFSDFPRTADVAGTAAEPPGNRRSVNILKDT